MKNAIVVCLVLETWRDGKWVEARGFKEKKRGREEGLGQRPIHARLAEATRLPDGVGLSAYTLRDRNRRVWKGKGVGRVATKGARALGLARRAAPVALV